MTRRQYIGDDMTTRPGRAGLSQRLEKAKAAKLVSSQQVKAARQERRERGE